MKVYHASNTIIKRPDTLHSRVALDFGQGFYVTVLREQAIKYGERFKLRKQQAFLNVYELSDGWQAKNIKKFTAYDAEWLDFITQTADNAPSFLMTAWKEALQTTGYSARLTCFYHRISVETKPLKDFDSKSPTIRFAS